MRNELKKYKSIEWRLLKEYMDYNPSTGEITRLKETGSVGRKGVVVGSTHRTGYTTFRLHGREYMCHRAAWSMYHETEEFGELDHINGIRDDNRIDNLRIVNRSENQQNKAVNSNNSSGHTGVSKHKYGWRAIITKNRIRYSKNLNNFEDACDWYREKKRELHTNHGEYVSRVNNYRNQK